MSRSSTPFVQAWAVRAGPPQLIVSREHRPEQLTRRLEVFAPAMATGNVSNPRIFGAPHGVSIVQCEGGGHGDVSMFAMDARDRRMLGNEAPQLGCQRRQGRWLVWWSTRRGGGRPGRLRRRR
ncbi:hypothetical protein P171DRAFT_214651 [Karstenula rhodostoma CBS 690.94]|uniref:Uncharacterized protein n=1 Tax=Karstenula rhodostoma CBS 690.94 TaxID=1392251 RepID=A0A9P4PTA0_9PLEO|nr:hypothetical protein P171DRAFT_214651 [Karstenula rhodostoma CBS 690.94]